MKDINNILIVSLSNIGDVILTLPVAGALREEYPRAKISILVGVKGYQVVKNNPEFHEVFIYDKSITLKEKISFIRKLRSKKYELAIDLRHSLFPLFIGAKYHTPLLMREINPKEHRVKKHLRSLEKLGIKTEKPKFPFYVSPFAQKRVKEKLGENINKDVIVVNPTAASHLKCWGDDCFLSLAEKIKEVFNPTIIFIGGKEEIDKEKCKKISNRVKGSINLCGELELEELAALLKVAKIFITNDSGPLHLASALNVPTLAIFGPTDALKYGPLSFWNRVVRKNLSCSPCELAQCPREHECMKLISVEDVFSAFKELFNERKSA